MKVSLASQIAEIDRELAQRKQVYPRLVQTRKMNERLAEIQVKHLQAVRETLVWLKDNERVLKHRLAQ